jgi:hypothetical protein
MPRRLIAAFLLVAAWATAVPGALAKPAWPSRATPLSSTLGWFQAINAHNRSKLLFYVAPSARDQMGWARPSVAWSKFTNLHCTTRTASGSSSDQRCTFHESPSPSDAEIDTFWDVYLHRTRGNWLIYSYGQG